MSEVVKCDYCQRTIGAEAPSWEVVFDLPQKKDAVACCSSCALSALARSIDFHKVTIDEALRKITVSGAKALETTVPKIPPIIIEEPVELREVPSGEKEQTKGS